jgi:hypothetical protein
MNYPELSMAVLLTAVQRRRTSSSSVEVSQVTSQLSKPDKQASR